MIVVRVDRKAGIPLYVQVREALRAEVQSLEPGTAIPTEAELEERFGVSRITIRKAVEELVSEGLVVRQQGRGTFVQRPKLTHVLNSITSWTERLAALGYTPKTLDTEASVVEAPKRIAQMLELGEGEEVVRLKRLRLASHEPISLMINYLPKRLVPGLAERIGDYESLYVLLKEQYGLAPVVAEDTVETKEATEHEAELLKIEPWSPVLLVTRVSYLESGEPLEVAIVTSRGDRYQYKVRLYDRSHPI